MKKLRIAFFGSPSRFSERALVEVAAAGQLVAAVLPGARRTGLRKALDGLVLAARRSPLRMLARDLGSEVIDAGDLGGPTCERLRALRPDLLCVAIFPHRLPGELLAVAPLGAINAHPSLLPRHRGPLPLFWTYHADDRFAGVTVHHASDRLDAGDIILQERFALPRAYPVAALDSDVAERAAPLLRAAVDAISRGVARRTPQDESAATYAPVVRPGTAMVDFERWDVERVWHFLAGLCPPYREPLVDDRGQPVAYRSIAGFTRGTAPDPAGGVRRVGSGWLLSCRGGTVQLERSAASSRAARD